MNETQTQEPRTRSITELGLYVIAAVAFGAVIIQLGAITGLATVALLGLAAVMVINGLENTLEDAAYMLLKLAATRRAHRLERAAQIRERRIQFLEETN